MYYLIVSLFEDCLNDDKKAASVLGVSTRQIRYYKAWLVRNDYLSREYNPVKKRFVYDYTKTALNFFKDLLTSLVVRLAELHTITFKSVEVG